MKTDVGNAPGTVKADGTSDAAETTGASQAKQRMPVQSMVYDYSLGTRGPSKLAQNVEDISQQSSGSFMEVINHTHDYQLPNEVLFKTQID